jgi:hypothetical protein
MMLGRSNNGMKIIKAKNLHEMAIENAKENFVKSFFKKK